MKNHISFSSHPPLPENEELPRIKPPRPPKGGTGMKLRFLDELDHLACHPFYNLERSRSAGEKET
jgi:hypothetical protein